MEKKIKKASGGKRNNAGRKPQPETEKKVPLFIYPKQCDIDILGGKAEVKDITEIYIADLAKQKRAAKTL